METAQRQTAVTETDAGRESFAQVKDRLNNAAKVRDLKDDLARALGVSKSNLRAQFHNVEHHRAHLASSFYVSPFERAALLSIDGFGDFISTMWARRRRELDQGSGPGRVSALDRHRLHRDDAVSRLSALRRRRQSDGAGAVWQAAIHRRVSRHHSHRRARTVSSEPRLLSSSCGRRRYDLGPGLAGDRANLFRRVCATRLDRRASPARR